MSEDEVWQRVLQAMPLCGCGTQLQPGRAGDQHVLVCTGCSAVSVADPDWVDRVVAEARA